MFKVCPAYKDTMA